MKANLTKEIKIRAELLHESGFFGVVERTAKRKIVLVKVATRDANTLTIPMHKRSQIGQNIH